MWQELGDSEDSTNRSGVIPDDNTARSRALGDLWQESALYAEACPVMVTEWQTLVHLQENVGLSLSYCGRQWWNWPSWLGISAGERRISATQERGLRETGGSVLSALVLGWLTGTDSGKAEEMMRTGQSVLKRPNNSVCLFGLTKEEWVWVWLRCINASKHKH